MSRNFAPNSCALLLFLSFFLTETAYTGEPQNVRLNKSSLSTLLNQKTIASIKRDQSGFLWVGTQRGLHRYDGNKVSTYLASNTGEFSAPSSDIRHIEIAKNGDIWIATLGGGVAKYDEKRNQFISIDSASSTPFKYVTSLLETSNRLLWIGTRDSGIQIYDPQMGEFVTWLKNEPNNSSIRLPSDMVELPSGNVWIGSASGLFVISPALQTVTRYELPASIRDPDGQNGIQAIELESEDVIWVGTDSGHLLKFDTKERKFFRTRKLETVSFGAVKDISFTFNRLWIATDQGLYSVNPVSFEARKFTKNNSSLSNSHVATLYRDRRALWIGTYYGLDIATRSSFDLFNQVNSGVADEVLSFSEDTTGGIWIGTYNGAYYLEQGSSSHKSLITLNGIDEIRDTRVMSIAVKDTELWLGYRHQGFQIIDLEHNTASLDNETDTLDFATTKILHASNGYTWVGTYDQGLYFIDTHANRELIEFPRNKHLDFKASTITALYESTEGHIFIGTEKGLYFYSQEQSQFKLYDTFGTTTLPTILSLSEDHNGDLWVGTKDDGVFIVSVNKSTGLKGLRKIIPESIGAAYAMEFDSSGYAWISTTKGLKKFSADGMLIRKYSYTDGLQGEDFNFGASHKDSKGRIYFGGSNGYNRFDPANVDLEIPPPRIALTEVTIAGEKPALPLPLHDMKLLELAYEDYFITLIFSALDFIDPENNRFRYKLDGFDPDWVDNEARNSATYTNLPAGEYTFRVIGANSAGVWNLEGASINIRVLPPWWLTWWAYTCYIVATLICLTFFKRYYDSKVIARKATAMAVTMRVEADRANDDLQEQLELQDDLVKSLSRHNAGTLDQIMELVDIQAEFFDDSQIIEALKSSQGRVQALGHLQSTMFYHGDSLYADMKSYTDLITRQLLHSSPIPPESITTVNEVTSRLVPASIATPLALIMFEIVENCMLHAFTEDAPANYISISMTQTANDQSGVQELVLSVQDNGVGIPESLLGPRPISHGLSMVSLLAERLDAVVDYSVADGTRFQLTISEPPLFINPYGGLN